jgi:glycosyltransferase involved in cell wall biosynthesis
MLLIDGIYINKGGGKILLDLLISKFDNDILPVTFLLDKRVEHDYPQLKGSVIFLKASIFKRHIFYKKNHHKFTSVLTFGNVPPTLKLNCNVYTYFHNVLLLESRIGLKHIKNHLKSFIIRLFSNNTDTWIVQSYYIKNLLIKHISLEHKKVLVLPIFDDNIFYNREINIKPNYNDIKFLYVSTGELHKNHKNLFMAFEKYNKLYPYCSLTVTISNDYKKIIKLINKYKNNNINIINIGYVSKTKLNEIYKKCDICLFPSLNESFGLGLVEAAQFDLPIFASNLDYVFQLIEPSQTFDPTNIDDIYEKLLKSNELLNKKSKLLVKNQIDYIYKLVH